MTAEHKYEMTISLQTVEHLGLNLYSNTSAVISEAVANAWDADAKTVEITLEKDCITIKDDGCGMDTDDINNKYLTVGYQKRHLVPITPMLNRKVSICHALYAWREVFILNYHSNDVNRFLYPELRLSSRSVDKGTEHSAPLSALFYFLPFFPRLPFFSSDGLPLPLPSFINLFASSISSFISTINTFSFSSHSSRVRA